MRYQIVLATVCSCALLTFAAPRSYADNASPIYASVGSWQIRADSTVVGCFAIVTYLDGTALRVGVGIDEGQLKPYVMLGNEEWTSIEYGKNYPLELHFGNESPWTGDAVGFSFNPPEDQSYLLLYGDSDQVELLFDEFMRERDVEAVYNGKSVLHGKLDGSYQAGLKVIECQAALMDAWGSEEPRQTKGNDPFRDATRTSSRNDPFSQ